MPPLDVAGVGSVSRAPSPDQVRDDVGGLLGVFMLPDAYHEDDHFGRAEHDVGLTSQARQHVTFHSKPQTRPVQHGPEGHLSGAVSRRRWRRIRCSASGDDAGGRGIRSARTSCRTRWPSARSCCRSETSPPVARAPGSGRGRRSRGQLDEPPDACIATRDVPPQGHVRDGRTYPAPQPHHVHHSASSGVHPHRLVRGCFDHLEAEVDVGWIPGEHLDRWVRDPWWPGALRHGDLHRQWVLVGQVVHRGRGQQGIPPPGAPGTPPPAGPRTTVSVCGRLAGG